MGGIRCLPPFFFCLFFFSNNTNKWKRVRGEDHKAYTVEFQQEMHRACVGGQFKRVAWLIKFIHIVEVLQYKFEDNDIEFMAVAVRNPYTLEERIEIPIRFKKCEHN